MRSSITLLVAYNTAMGVSALKGSLVQTGTLTGFTGTGGAGTTSVSYTGASGDPVVGDVITITGTSNYNGTFNVTAVVPGTSFVMDKTFSGNDGAVGVFETTAIPGNNNNALASRRWRQTLRVIKTMRSGNKLS